MFGESDVSPRQANSPRDYDYLFKILLIGNSGNIRIQRLLYLF